MCETVTNDDILRLPSAIIVLSFNHQVCFHNKIRPALTAQESEKPFFTRQRGYTCA